jgi:hypothetical protein
MGKLLQAALRSKGVINDDDQVDSSKIRDRSVIGSAVAEFAEKLLEHKVEKKPGAVRRASFDALQPPEQRQQQGVGGKS